MSSAEAITYICDVCGYTNVWTRDQVVQRGTIVVYRGDETDEYIVPCKNPIRPPCTGQRKIGLKRKR